MEKVTIQAHFKRLEERIVFEAVVLPEIYAVLDKYANLLEENGGK